MPRISSKDTKEVVKRAPRRQVVRKTASPRVKKALDTDVVERRIEKESEPVRKAPTRVNENRPKVFFSRKTIVFSGALVAVFALAIWIGTTDEGQINVASKLEERNKQIANGQFTADNSSGINGSQVIPVQNSESNVPNGGLRGRGVGTESATQQAAVVATEDINASSTDTSTSTEVNTESGDVDKTATGTPETVGEDGAAEASSTEADSQ